MADTTPTDQVGQPGPDHFQTSESENGPHPRIVIVGAGPAGLTAAYQLGKSGIASTVLEATDVVGGISQTAERDGWKFDIGGHRFFTKVQRSTTRASSSTTRSSR
jgi:protoporphyrinogen oxidase